MTRIGFGYDSHRLAGPGPVVLGGVQIPHDQGFDAHSDGDVAIHALVDAILGALAAGDIGEHFPDTDPRWADQPSAIFLEHAVDLAATQGWRLGNCDLTILAEVPKLTPHKSAIRDRLAALLRTDPANVSVKAKTNEAMGFIGRREGIAAYAAVLLIPADAT